MGGKRAAISGAWFGARLVRRPIGFVFGMYGRNGRFQVFQCEIELLGISLLGLAAEGSLLEGGDQLLKPFDPLILANFTRLRAISIAFKVVILSGRSAASNMVEAYQSQRRFVVGICRPSHCAASTRYLPALSPPRHGPDANRAVQTTPRTEHGPRSSGHT